MKSTTVASLKYAGARGKFWQVATTFVLTIGAGCAGFFAADALFNKSDNVPYAGPLGALSAAAAVGTATRKRTIEESTFTAVVQPTAAPVQSEVAPETKVSLLESTPLPTSPLVQYFFEGSGQKPLCIVVRVRATGVEQLGSWRKALKQCVGIQWNPKVYRREIAGRKVRIVAGYIPLAEDLSMTEKKVLERDLQTANIRPYTNDRFSLVFLQLSQHCAKFNPQSALFEESMHFDASLRRDIL